jgi:gliding motility-associated protein GldM
MSGGNCPETPRQKMIGMMYLFLTAMLALNVSGELLKAFKLVDISIQQSVKSLNSKNAVIYQGLENAASTNPRAKEPWDKAQKVREEADKLYNHIQELKLLMVHTVDNPNATPDNYQGVDNQDIAAQLMITEQGGKRSEELKAEIVKYREFLLSIVDSDTLLKNSISKTLNTDDIITEETKEKKPWQSEKFEHIPMAATLALMSKMMGDVRNTENDVIRYLNTMIDAGSFKFNTVEPFVNVRSETVIRGGEYYAEIMMAARDSEAKPKVIIGGSELPVNERGQGVYKVPASSIGKKSWSGEIQVLGPAGDWVRYPVKGEYDVVQPLVVISPTKMNVFYEGVDNPVTISVPGVNSKQLSININNATYSKSGDEFMIKPNPGSAGGKANITVIADIEGKKQTVGSMEFRIKRIPPPIAKVGGINEGKLSKGRLLAESGVFAVMEDFDFELTYNITRFNVSVVKNGYQVDEPSKNNRFTEQQKELIKGLARGSKVFINDIKAVGPDKVTKSLGSVTITLD